MPSVQYPMPTSVSTPAREATQVYLNLLCRQGVGAIDISILRDTACSDGLTKTKGPDEPNPQIPNMPAVKSINQTNAPPTPYPGTNPFFLICSASPTPNSTPSYKDSNKSFFVCIVNHRDIRFLKVIEQTIQLIQLNRFGTPVPI